MRRPFLLVVGLIVGMSALVRPNEASATPVTITFTSGWGFYDAGMTDPGALNFFAAMAAIGVTQGCTGCLSLSLTIDDAATPDALNAVPVRGEIVVGSQSFDLSGSSDPQLNGFFTMTGPTLTSGGINYVPRNVQFSAPNSFSSFTSWPSALAVASQWPMIPALVVFTSPGYEMGFAGWTVTSVSVPEPSTLALMSAGIVGLIVSDRRLRRKLM